MGGFGGLSRVQFPRYSSGSVIVLGDGGPCKHTVPNPELLSSQDRSVPSTDSDLWRAAEPGAPPFRALCDRVGVSFAEAKTTALPQLTPKIPRRSLWNLPSIRAAGCPHISILMCGVEHGIRTSSPEGRPGGSRGLQAPESRPNSKRGFSPGPSFRSRKIEFLLHWSLKAILWRHEIS
jgi:hypothetical protein